MACGTVAYATFLKPTSCYAWPREGPLANTKYKTASAAALVAALAAACSPVPIKPSPTHLSAADVRPAAPIPPPVEAAPPLPAPQPSVRPETYSVVVNKVPVSDLLFALAKDARLNVDIGPNITGTVTLNAIDQTLPQILERIARQVDIRYRIEGANLVVERDTPYLHTYQVNYVNVSRDTKVVATLSTQVNANTVGPGQAAAATDNNSTATINSVSVNAFWSTLVANIRQIVGESSGGAVQAAGQPAAGQAPAPAASAVIANPEAGIISVRATARQQARVQQFLDQVMANVRRQVLIEVTVAEVRLNHDYQRGIDWSRLRGGSSGFSFSQSSVNTPASIDTNAFTVGYALGRLNFTAALRLLDSFGDVRVLSSPKLNVLNNQFAVLKVVDNIVYFTVQASTTSTAQVGTTQTFNTTPNTVPVGLIMTVVPQISATDSVVLDVRPSISRLLGFVADPNPALTTVSNLVPQIQTREMESVLRLQSGQIAVLGGLMEDSVSRAEDAIPGVREVPGLGELLAQRHDQSQKTELVIFLRATAIRDPSVEGDFARFRPLLPSPDFLQRTPFPELR